MYKLKNILKKYRMLVMMPVAILSLMVSSCSLDRSPLDSFREEVFWTSEENAMLAVAGLYRGTIGFGVDYNISDWWSYSAVIIMDGVSDIGYDRRGFNNHMGRLTSGGLQSNNLLLEKTWENSYKRIEQCNRFLESVDKVPSTPEFISRVKSEARFIRACQYFYLASYYGSVPLVKTLISLEEANTISKTPKADVLEFIVAEFTEIASILPRQKDIPASEIGRACRQAAYSFLGKAKVLQKDWTGAAAAFKAIIDFNDSEIAPKYKELFYTANENSTENIFSNQYVDNLAGNGLPQHAFPIMKSGWCLVNPIANLMEAYDFKNGDPFSYDHPCFDVKVVGKNRDPRLDYTIYYNGATFCGLTWICDPSTTSLDKIGAGQVTQTGYLLRKYFNEAWVGDISSYGANMPIVRYADVLLMYLECELEAGTAITKAMLDATINKIRSRADVKMPNIIQTDSELLRKLIRKERMIELAFEGHRLWDLFRWDIAEQELNKPIYGASFEYVTDKDLIKKKGGEDGSHDSNYRWYVNTRSFKKEQQVWPVPLDQQNINPNLR